MSIKANSGIKTQDVFVAADTRSKLKLLMTMRYMALNPRLKDACMRVGLSHRNMTYSVRRATLAKILRKYGTEIAETLASHALDSCILQSYCDNFSLGEVDIQGWRFDIETASLKH
jgi:hypothetical protein